MCQQAKTTKANKQTQRKPHGVEEFGIEKATCRRAITEKPLIVSLSSLPGNFFAGEALVALCMLGKNSKIKTTVLLDMGATKYLFVDPAMTRCLCDKLVIELIQLSKPKAIQGFDGKQAPSVTHAIYPIMTVKDHRETTTLMLITKLNQHQIILRKPWMKKHGAVLDMRNDQLSFWPGYYQHHVALRLPPAESHAEEPQPLAEKSRKKLSVEEPHAKPRIEEPRAKEPQAGRPIIILKQQLNELLELLPYLLPSTQGVSKSANTLGAIEPEKKKKSQAS